MESIVVHYTEACPGHGEPRIEVDGLLVERDRLSELTVIGPLIAQAERTQSFERAGGGLLDGRVEALHRWQRLSHLAPEARRRITERVQHLFLARRFHLRARQAVARVAANGFQRDHILRPQRHDRTVEKSFDALTLADLAGDRRGQSLASGPPHVPQRFANAAL